MMEINYITTKLEKELSGRSIYEKKIQERLKNVNFNTIEYVPSKIDIEGISLVFRAINKLFCFPYQVRRKIKKDQVTHITSEDLAYLLNFIKLKKSVVTCHDLARLVYYKGSHSLFWKFNVKGLKKADRIITVSNFSKNEIIKYLGYSGDKIEVIPDAVDHQLYFQKRNKEILKKYNISEKEKIILFVGSEQPKQNLPFLIKSFYELKKILPEVKLLKIGNPQQSGAREKLIDLIKKLGLEKEIIFLGYINEKELPQWYNAADLFVYPCLYAGFGIPPLEAMTCGTPVITSNLTSLPEVMGDAGIMIDPYNQKEMIKAMHEVLTNENLRRKVIKKGLKRAEMFTWEKSAEETLKTYRKLTFAQ